MWQTYIAIAARVISLQNTAASFRDLVRREAARLLHPGLPSALSNRRLRQHYLGPLR